MKILVLPGDGIGPEITRATVEVLQTADEVFCLGLEFQTREIGLAALKSHGTTLSAEVMKLVPEVDGVILGPVSHYDYPSRQEGGINPSAELRVAFELYANIRPSRSRRELSILRRPMDLVIVRENTEGFYSDRNMFAGSGEFMPDPDMAFSIRKITAKSSARVARAAFELAQRRKRKVTAVHKANVVKLSDGLFLREVRKVAKAYPQVSLDELIVDATAALLIRNPDRFDVIVTTNMFGDILSDEAAELSGSLGLGGAINVGDAICVAQAQHGSAPDIAGRNIANPSSLILSAAMLLDWRGRRDNKPRLIAGAAAVEDAIDRVLADPATRTRDLGGELGTTQFGAAVCAAIHRGGSSQTDGAATVAGELSLGPAATIIRPSQLTARERGGGVRTIPLVTRAHGATTFINGITIFDPGAAVPLHRHNCEESVVIMEGHALVEIDGHEFEVGPQETTFLPANIPHRFRNASSTESLRILWTYASVNADRTIVATGDTRRIDGEHSTNSG